MPRRGYPPEFRRRVVDFVEAGRRVSDVASELGISEQAVYNWRRQSRVGAGRKAGLPTSERAELYAANRRIRELETELAVHRHSAELLKKTSRPKGGTRRSR